MDEVGILAALGRAAADEPAALRALAAVGAGAPEAVLSRVRGLLLETGSARVRNAACLALLDAVDPLGPDAVRAALSRPGAGRSAGTPLYVLGRMGAGIGLATAVALVLDGSFEARGEVLGLLEEGAVLPFGEAEMQEALSALNAMRRREGGDARLAAEMALDIVEGPGFPRPSGRPGP